MPQMILYKHFWLEQKKREAGTSRPSIIEQSPQQATQEFNNFIKRVSNG
jgi:hypothetical protein